MTAKGTTVGITVALTGALTHRMRETLFTELVTHAYCAFKKFCCAQFFKCSRENAAKALFLPCSPIRSI